MLGHLRFRLYTSRQSPPAAHITVFILTAFLTSNSERLIICMPQQGATSQKYAYQILAFYGAAPWLRGLSPVMKPSPMGLLDTHVHPAGHFI